MNAKQITIRSIRAIQTKSALDRVVRQCSKREMNDDHLNASCRQALVVKYRAINPEDESVNGDGYNDTYCNIIY